MGVLSRDYDKCNKYSVCKSACVYMDRYAVINIIYNNGIKFMLQL